MGVRKILAFFFWCKIKISVGNIFFFTSKEVKFLTFQNFTDVRFGPFSNPAGVSFRRKLKSNGRKIWIYFFGNYVEESWKKTTTHALAILGRFQAN